MKQMKLRFAVVTAAISVIAVGNCFAGSRPKCRQSRAIVGACFAVRGSLFASNGTPGLRIWRIGTRRILGVVDNNGEAEGDTLATPWLIRTLAANGSGTRIYGTYEVCPLTRARRGAMKMVCVANARQLTIRR